MEEGASMTTDDVKIGVETENQEAAGSSPDPPPLLFVLIMSPFILLGLMLWGVMSMPMTILAVAPFIIFFTVVLPIMYIIRFSIPDGVLTITYKVVIMLRGGSTGGEDKSKGNLEIGHMYNKARRQERKWMHIRSKRSRMLARASLSTLVWLVLSLFVERLKGVEILGSPMWKWSLLGVALTAAWFFLAIPMGIAVHGSEFWQVVDETTQYYMVALLPSMVSTVYFGMFLGAWVAYFSTSHSLSPSHQAFEIVTWTSISLLVGSLLCMFKAFLIAKWRADAIYRRFEPRIFITSLKYFFIGYCAAGFYQGRFVETILSSSFNHNAHHQRTGYTSKLHNASGKMGLIKLTYVSNVLTSLVQIMTPLLDRDNNQEEVVTWFNQHIKDSDTTPPQDKCIQRSLEELFQSAEPPTAVKLWSRCTRKVSQVWSRWTRDTREMSSRGSRYNNSKKKPRSGDRYKEKTENKPELANVLLGLVREELSSTADITFQDLKIWMVDAHKDCTNMGRTLADANQMVNCLDMFMSCVVVVIVLLLWLLITGVSSTTVLVTVATPFLALSFIFGDTAKTFFQGLVFCFCTHPFDVGDRCILDDTELEVKNVSILTTTFMKIGSKEKRLYPNAVLASKAIVNLGWQPDPRDSIVVTLPLSTNIELSETKIKGILANEKSLYNEKSLELVVEEVGENYKVQIQFTHVLTLHDMSHNQCFNKKRKQRTIFLEIIKKYIQESLTNKADQPKPNVLPSNEIEESK